MNEPENLEIDTFEWTVEDGIVKLNPIRVFVTEQEKYEWLRPPSQIYYLQDEAGNFLPDYAPLFESGEWVDTHDGGWLVRGRLLTDEEIQSRGR